MNYNDNKNKYFGKSQIYDIYKEIQNEIKDKVITKFLRLIENLHKEVTALRKENISLKNHLSYILKRIILHKNDFNKSNPNQNNIRKITTDRKRQWSYKPQKSINYDYPERRPYNYSAKKHKTINFEKTFNDSDIFNEKHNNSLIENKVNKYLNSIYRKNFPSSRNGLWNNLNKKESIYRELFPSNKSNNKKIFKTINYEESFIGKKYKTSKTKPRIKKEINKVNKSDIISSNSKTIKVMKNPNSNNHTQKRLFKIKDYNEEIIKDTYFDLDDFDIYKNIIEYNYNNTNSGNYYNSRNTNLIEYNYNNTNSGKDYNSRNTTNKYTRTNNFNPRTTRNNYGDKIRAKKEFLYLK